MGIELKNITKKYNNAKNYALFDINLNIHQGLCTGILGQNGAGKSTLIEIILGLKKTTTGTINISLDEKKVLNIKEKVAGMLQHSAFIHFLTAKEFLNLIASMYKNKYSLTEITAMFSLDKFINKKLSELSGGQKQRVLLASAIIGKAEIILLDEPTVGLDPITRNDFWQIIKKLKTENKTIILTTQYMEEAQELCDYLVFIQEGKIVEHGTPQILIKNLLKGYEDNLLYHKTSNINLNDVFINILSKN